MNLAFSDSSDAAGAAQALLRPAEVCAEDCWWHELNCRNARAAISFYGRLLGWRFEALELANGEEYHIAWQGDRAVCGVLQMDPARHGDLPDHWMAYLLTPSLEAALRAVALAGGEILRPPLAVPGVGRLALLADSGGAIVGLVEPAAMQSGQPRAEEHG